MGERNPQRTRDHGDVEVPVEPTEDAGDPAASNGLRGRLRDGTTSVFSIRAFLLATVLCLGGLFVIGGFVPLPGSGLLGILAASLLYGIGTDESRYAEHAIAGAVVGGGAALLDHLVWALIGVGLPLVAFGVVAGGLAGIVGHYFGRDLRAGWTEEV